MWVVPSVCAVVYRYQLIVLKPDGTSFRVFYLHIQGYAPIHREDLQCIRHGTSHNHSQTALKYFHLIFYSLRNYGFLRQAYTHNFIKQIFRLFGIGLIQSALQPLWVLACSTIVEYSQQEGFYRVALPAARQTPNLEDQWLERSNSRHQVSPASQKRRERTTAAEGGTMGEKLPRILAKVATSMSLLGYFTCRKFTTWDRRIYFPSEGRRAEDFCARKIRRLRPGLNLRTWALKASTLTSRPPKPLYV